MQVMIELVSWDVAIPVMMVLVFAQLASGVIYVRFVAPWAGERKLSEWLFLAIFATSLPVFFAFIGALIGQKSGDWLMAMTCFLMWIAQIPFMIGGLPVLDSAQYEARRQIERERELQRVRDGAA